MKKIFILCFVCCISLNIPLQAQISLDTGQLSVDDDISDKEKEELIKLIEKSFERYTYASRFLTDGDVDMFINFFGSNIETYNDIQLNGSKEYLHPIEYTELVSTLFPDGIDFKVSNIKLLKLGINEFYDYLAIITFDKDVISLELNDKIASQQRLTLTINSFDYSIEISKIKGVTLTDDEPPILLDTILSEVEMLEDEVAIQETDTSKVGEISTEDLDDLIILNDADSDEDDPEKDDSKEIIADESNSSSESSFGLRKFLFFSTGVSSGTISLSNALDNYPFDSDQINSSYRGLPNFSIKFSNSLDKKRKWYLDASFHYESSRIETDISSFFHDIQSPGIESNSDIISAQSNGENSSLELDILEESSIRILKDFEGRIDGGLETIEISLLGFETGIAYELFRNGSGTAFLMSHAALGLNYISKRGVNNISYQGIIENGIKLPTSELFPLQEIASSGFEEIRDLETQAIIQDYTTDDADEISTISSGTDNSIMVNARLGLSFLKKIKYRFGLVGNISFLQGITPLFSQRMEENKFLEGEIESWNSSVLEHYHSNVNLQKLEFSLGVFFILNQ